jgi:hypothetical protein
MESTDWVTTYMPFGKRYLCHPDQLVLTVSVGFMKDMQGVNTLNQLMDNAGQPTALGQKYLNP